MPLLISAAAVQLTFGLRNYMLDYFNTIYVLRDNYRYGFYNRPLEGHVSGDGIYLSWNNFIRQYNDYNDGQNVGLHELAHALTYVNFNAQDGVDEEFHDKFKDFSKVARPVFARMQSGESNLLDKYAATNYDEFWAVSVETFFERPEEFRKQLPGLYFALCHLLNQDPLTPRKIISLVENV
jgi:Mlc titration factor MtfA (ptsG expression regulator)